ncbi:MAG: SDR family oxidoreductase [Coxiellaceae bacterium]|nr:SDR family oxidoreductase [Coxiellaceae bacterium]
MKSKEALVTGGTRGIGLAIAKRLRRDGCNVTITGTRSDYRVDEEFNYMSVDLSCHKQRDNFISQVKQNHFDVLINNAGVNIINDFDRISEEDFTKVHEINLLSCLRVCQSVLPGMKKNKWGRIINIASIWSQISKSGRASYSASKFGLDGMTAALAAEVAEHGVLVNCVSPGFIETDLTKQSLGESGIKDISKTIPIRRLGRPNEIAAFVSWLVSEENSYISAQNLVIDGGFTRV